MAKKGFPVQLINHESSFFFFFFSGIIISREKIYGKDKKYIARKPKRVVGFFSFSAAIINVDVDIEMILKNKSRKGSPWWRYV